MFSPRPYNLMSNGQPIVYGTCAKCKKPVTIIGETRTETVNTVTVSEIYCRKCKQQRKEHE